MQFVLRTRRQRFKRQASSREVPDRGPKDTKSIETKRLRIDYEKPAEGWLPRFPRFVVRVGHPLCLRCEPCCRTFPSNLLGRLALFGRMERVNGSRSRWGHLAWVPLWPALSPHLVGWWGV